VILITFVLLFYMMLLRSRFYRCTVTVKIYDTLVINLRIIKFPLVAQNVNLHGHVLLERTLC
jgi:hypothetical protein